MVLSGINDFIKNIFTLLSNIYLSYFFVNTLNNITHQLNFKVKLKVNIFNKNVVQVK